MLGGLVAACGGAAIPPAPPAPVPTSRPAPAATAIEQLVVSTTGSCGVLSDHTALCWGDWESSMIRVAAAAAELRDVSELRIGHAIKLDPQRYYDHLCSRDLNHAVQCWGNNQQGQVGAAVSGDAASPSPVDLPANVTQLALGAQHSCALTPPGEVRCWGNNEFGQAGAGTGTPTVARPRAVAGLAPVAQLVTGSDSTCAVTADHRVYCWGQNRNEQATAAETGFEPEVWTPREIAIARGSERLAAGRSTYCGIQEAGSVMCWGFVGSLLGDAYLKHASGPVPGLAGVTALGLGDHHACALTGGGEVWCFGKGEHGELGNGEPTPTTQPPRRVALPGPATAISVGAQAACARLQDGRWWCWGGNRSGELAADKQPIWTPAVLELSKIDRAG